MLSRSSEKQLTTVNLDVKPEETLCLVNVNQTEATVPENEHPLLIYLRDELTNKSIVTQSQLQSAMTGALKGGAIVIGSLSGLPYVSASRQFAGNNTVLGWFLGYGIFTSLAVVSAYAMLDVVHAATGRTKLEKQIIKRQYSRKKEVAYWVMLPSLGLCAAFPMSYLMYKYNDNSLFYAGVSLFTDLITNTCSLNRSVIDLEREIPFYIGTQQGKDREILRDKLIKGLEKSTQMLHMLSSVQLNELLPYNAKLLFSVNETKMLIYRLLELSDNKRQIKNEHAIWYGGAPRKLVKAVSMVFPLAWSVFGILNSYDSYELINNNTIFRWTMALLSNLPYLLLEMGLASSTFCDVYDYLVNKKFGTYDAPLTEVVYPLAYKVATTLGLFTTSCAFGSRAKFVTDEISGSLGIGLAVIVCISTVAYKSSAMMSLKETIFNRLLQSQSDVKLKEISYLNATLYKFTDLIRDCSPENFESLLEALDRKKLSTVLQSQPAQSSAASVGDSKSANDSQHSLLPLNLMDNSSSSSTQNEEDVPRNSWCCFWKKKKSDTATVPVVVSRNNNYCTFM